MIDYKAMGRKGGRAANGRAKAHPTRLSEQLVIQIRSSAEPTTDLAKLYGIKPNTICKARRGITWRWL
jgi:hypothetical protein